MDSAAGERLISLGPELPGIPERLLLAHARGRVVFIAGAGISRPAGLPDFRELVVQVYESLDKATHAVIAKIPSSAHRVQDADCPGLDHGQIAEVRRFVSKDYDVVLGLLERRFDLQGHGRSRVRQAVANALRLPNLIPAPIHKALIRLANRGDATTIITTNFDPLLEKAARSRGLSVQNYSLGGVPRPTYRDDFAGILHIHGVIDPRPARATEIILTDQDFGEFYLRRRAVSDFIYDAARLFHLVLVGYSANDPPMRYLMNAIAADGTRFSDVKERFTFVGADSPDPVALEDWKGRGITPIPYHAPRHDHGALTSVLERWAALSAINGRRSLVRSEVRRIVRSNRAMASESDRDLFDHFIRRGNAYERTQLSEVATKAGAEMAWLDAITAISQERDREGQ